MNMPMMDELSWTVGYPVISSCSELDSLNIGEEERRSSISYA